MPGLSDAVRVIEPGKTRSTVAPPLRRGNADGLLRLKRPRARLHTAQSATSSPGTRANSRMLAVTRVAPRRRACAAMSVS